MFDITDVRPIIQNLIHEYPDRTNPRDDMGYCLYDDGNGDRCIIGELLHELGLPVPNRIVSIDILAIDLPKTYGFTNKTIQYLSNIQQAADPHPNDPDKPWGSIDEDAIYMRPHTHNDV